jgi:hypothetical protein
MLCVYWPKGQLTSSLLARVMADNIRKGLIPRALFLGEMRIISPVSFELRPLE